MLSHSLSLFKLLKRLVVSFTIAWYPQNDGFLGKIQYMDLTV